VTKLKLGDNGVNKNTFTETSFPADVDKEALETLEVLDLQGLGFLKGSNGECFSCLKIVILLVVFRANTRLFQTLFKAGRF
jgi:hypothetical protein